MLTFIIAIWAVVSIGGGLLWMVTYTIRHKRAERRAERQHAELMDKLMRRTKP